MSADVCAGKLELVTALGHSFCSYFPALVGPSICGLDETVSKVFTLLYFVFSLSLTVLVPSSLVTTSYDMGSHGTRHTRCTRNVHKMHRYGGAQKH